MKKTTSLSKMVIVLCGLSICSALLLGMVYELTKEPIKKAKENKELEAIKEVVYQEFYNNPYAEKHKIFLGRKKGYVDLFPARDKNGKITSVAIKTYSNNGFGGRIELMVGFLVDGTINKYKVIEQKETPGLGTKITEKKFSHQFQGMHPERQIFKVKQDGGDVDAITAATISSRAVIDAIERGYKAYKKLSTGKSDE